MLAFAATDETRRALGGLLRRDLFLSPPLLCEILFSLAQCLPESQLPGEPIYTIINCCCRLRRRRALSTGGHSASLSLLVRLAPPRSVLSACVLVSPLYHKPSVSVFGVNVFGSFESASIIRRLFLSPPLLWEILFSLAQCLPESQLPGELASTSSYYHLLSTSSSG